VLCHHLVLLSVARSHNLIFGSTAFHVSAKNLKAHYYCLFVTAGHSAAFSRNRKTHRFQSASNPASHKRAIILTSSGHYVQYCIHLLTYLLTHSDTILTFTHLIFNLIVFLVLGRIGVTITSYIVLKFYLL